jgi:adenylylsulfate kinase
MKEEKGNIYTIFDEMMSREEKENLLQQKAKIIWLTGLSGSGKSTIAKLLERKFHDNGNICKLLDGDNVRAGINNNLGFSESDRKENIRRIAEVCRLFLDSGLICIASFVSPTKEIRAMAEEIIGKEDFFEVFIDTPLAICEERDVKGLYKKARAGEIADFTGISAPFEQPESPAFVLKTEDRTPDECTEDLFAFIKPQITRR